MFFIWYSKQTPSQDTNVCAARRLSSGVRPAARQEQSSLGRHGVPNYLYVSSLGAVRCCTHISRRAPCLKPGKGAQRACSEPSRSTRISKDFVWAPPRLVSCCLGRSVFVCLVGRHVYTRARSCRRLTGAFHKFSHVVILVKWIYRLTFTAPPALSPTERTPLMKFANESTWRLNHIRHGSIYKGRSSRWRSETS